MTGEGGLICQLPQHLVLCLESTAAGADVQPPADGKMPSFEKQLRYADFLEFMNHAAANGRSPCPVETSCSNAAACLVNYSCHLSIPP